MAYNPTYWSHRGRKQQMYNELRKKLSPNHRGRKLLNAISIIYYDLYNNGFGNGPFRNRRIDVETSTVMDFFLNLVTLLCARGNGT